MRRPRLRSAGPSSFVRLSRRIESIEISHTPVIRFGAQAKFQGIHLCTCVKKLYLTLICFLPAQRGQYVTIGLIIVEKQRLHAPNPYGSPHAPSGESNTGGWLHLKRKNNNHVEHRGNLP